MSVIAPVATQVGLQLLLQPYSNAIGSIACAVAGVAYPAYASFLAVEKLNVRGNGADAGKWLTYWGVFATFSVAERLLEKLLVWVPYYSTLKLALLLWLQLPRYQGASRLYHQFVRPAMRKVYPTVDHLLLLAQLHLRRPEVAAFGEMLHSGLARIPGLEWFVRGPDGRRSVPPPGGVGVPSANFITGG